MRERYHYTDEYILSHRWEWIASVAKYSLIEDARNKLWDLKIVSLSQQPGKEADARRLSEAFRETVDVLEDQISLLEKGSKKDKPSLDGEMIWVA